jgi:hypothetical protein
LIVDTVCADAVPISALRHTTVAKILFFIFLLFPNLFCSVRLIVRRQSEHFHSRPQRTFHLLSRSLWSAATQLAQGSSHCNAAVWLSASNDEMLRAK